MTKDEALKLALEWAEARGEIVFAGGGMDAVNKMNSWVTAIRKALAQPEQEPVASIFISGIGEREFDDWGHDLPVGRNLLYITPPQRTWVGLTVEDVHDCLKGLPTQSIEVYARSVEAKLKQKNGYAEEKNT